QAVRRFAGRSDTRSQTHIRQRRRKRVSGPADHRQAARPHAGADDRALRSSRSRSASQGRRRDRRHDRGGDGGRQGRRHCPDTQGRRALMAAPGDDCGEKKENIGQAKKEMAEFYWNAVDEEIEHLLQLFGDIPDAERSEAIKVIFRLVTYARGTAEFGALVPPGTAMLEKLNTEP